MGIYSSRARQLLLIARCLVQQVAYVLLLLLDLKWFVQSEKRTGQQQQTALLLLIFFLFLSCQVPKNTILVTFSINMYCINLKKYMSTEY